MKAFALVLAVAIFSGCAHKPAKVPPPPEIEKPAPPKLRAIRSGDLVMKGSPEVRPDGSVVCHKAVPVIDAKKPLEDVTTYNATKPCR